MIPADPDTLAAVHLHDLDVDHLQQREARWVWIDLVGKGSRLRSVPVPNWVKMLLDDWIVASGIRDGKGWLSSQPHYPSTRLSS